MRRGGLNDFRQELGMLKERPGGYVGLVSISPGILRAAEVISTRCVATSFS